MSKINKTQFAITAICSIAGAGVARIAYWLHSCSSALAWVVTGAIVGCVVGVLWPYLQSFLMRHKIDDWRLEEVEIQGLKFTSAGAQRRVAWRLFVEMTTRIATQPMRDEDGNDGIALESLRKLFDLTRTAVSEMQLTPSASGDTIETYALDMLNNDLRPFLSKWHPLWDDFAKNGKVDSQAWAGHKLFRDELRILQGKIESRAKGLATIAGAKNTERFFQKP